MSSYVCPICRDLLTEPQDIEPGNRKEDYHPMVAYCGHMYHQCCLMAWIEAQKNRGIPLSCPTCHEKIVRSDLVKVYPSSDENYEDYRSVMKRVEETTENLALMHSDMERDKDVLSKVLAENKIIKATIDELQDEFRELHKVKNAINIVRLHDEPKYDMDQVRRLNLKDREADKFKFVASLEQSIDHLIRIFKDYDEYKICTSTGTAEPIPIRAPAFHSTCIGSPSAASEENLTRSIIRSISYPSKEPVTIFLQGDSQYFSSAELFQLQLATFLRVLDIPFKIRILDVDAENTEIMQIDSQIIFCREICCTVIRTVFLRKDVNLEKGRLKYGADFLERPQNILETKLLWGIILWQWVYNGGKYMQILPHKNSEKVVEMFREQIGSIVAEHPMGSMTQARVDAIIIKCLKLLAEDLAQKDYFGGNLPSEVDCLAFVLFSEILWNMPESLYLNEMQAHENLLNFVKRMNMNYWPEWDNGYKPDLRLML